MDKEKVETIWLEVEPNLKMKGHVWVPTDGQLKGVVLLLHGYAEHSGRYAAVADYLVQHQFGVVAFDWFGHGESPGERAFISDENRFLAHIDLFYQEVKTRFPNQPYFLLGHSMGGGFATLYLIDRDPDFKGVILSAPALAVGKDIAPWQIKLSRFLAHFWPRLHLIKLDAQYISRDAKVVQAYQTDPLNYLGGAPVQTAVSLFNSLERIEAGMHRIELPLLILHGTADKIADCEGSKQLYQRAISKNKELKLYDGLYHEILNEPEREQVLADILSWLDKQID